MEKRNKSEHLVNSSLQKNKKNTDYIEFEEYYENNEENRENSLLGLEKYNKNIEFNKPSDILDQEKIKNLNGSTSINEQEGNYEDGQDYLEDEREDMENDFNLVKAYNELKEKNKKLESINKYQSAKIETLQNELDKVLNELNVKDSVLDVYKKDGTNSKSPEYKKNAMLTNQVNNLNLQVEKYKNLLSDKKAEFSGLLEKYNDLQKTVDKNLTLEKKMKSELISKEKQIVRLLEELERRGKDQDNHSGIKNDREIETLTNEVKKMEKQKNDLYIAFKKALKLVSILKRQKIHLENARMIAFSEDEFKQMLSQNKV
jgi:hypothetical protein